MNFILDLANIYYTKISSALHIIHNIKNAILIKIVVSKCFLGKIIKLLKPVLLKYIYIFSGAILPYNINSN